MTKQIPRDPRGFTLLFNPLTGVDELVKALIAMPGDPDYKDIHPNEKIDFIGNNQFYIGNDGRQYETLEALREANKFYTARMFPKKPNLDLIDKGPFYRGDDGREYATYEDLKRANELHTKRMFPKKPSRLD